MCLTVSGGHTQIVYALKWRVGSTIDDAVGEAFDKVQENNWIRYPAGPLIDHHAKRETNQNTLLIRCRRNEL